MLDLRTQNCVQREKQGQKPQELQSGRGVMIKTRRYTSLSLFLD